MNLTDEQMGYIYKHLRDPQKAFSICAIAKKLSQNNNDMHLDQDEVELAALLMNIGETSDKMLVNGVSIYSKEYGPWDDKAKQLNVDRGQLSVEMAEEQGIDLSQGAKEAIVSTSKGGSLNKIAITLKLAQTMEAIKYPRWSRGEKKEPAKDIVEVTEILNEELSFMLREQDIDDETKRKIQESMISAARATYVEEKQSNIRRLIGTVVMATERELDMNSDVASHVGSTTLTEERINKLLENIPDERIDEIFTSLEGVANNDTYTAIRREDVICRLVSEWENGKIDKPRKEHEEI